MAPEDHIFSSCFLGQKWDLTHHLC